MAIRKDSEKSISDAMNFASMRSPLLPEVSVASAPIFVWLVDQCSRVCSRMYVSCDESGLEIGGSDKDGLLAIKLRLPHVKSMNGPKKFSCKTPSILTTKRYSQRFSLPTEVILTLCKAGSICPEVLELKISGRQLQLFRTSNIEQYLVSINVDSLPADASADSIVHGVALRRIAELIRKAGTQHIDLFAETRKPIKMTFDFSEIAHVTILLVSPAPGSNDSVEFGKSEMPPHFEGSPIVELIAFVGLRASGVDLALLRSAGLDTASSLNVRQSEGLGLITVSNGFARITRDGKAFLNLLRTDVNRAKEMLRELASRRIPSYRLIALRLRSSPSSADELFTFIQQRSSINVSLDEVQSLMSILTWAGYAKRKLALKYSLATKNGRSSRQASDPIL